MQSRQRASARTGLALAPANAGDLRLVVGHDLVIGILHAGFAIGADINELIGVRRKCGKTRSDSRSAENNCE